MSTNPYIWLLIPLAALVVIILGGILVTRLQKATAAASATALATLDRNAAGAGAETREEFVRRHRHQPGVVANGETLVDLYDRIRELEERLAAIEAAPRS
ncbi:hypothetical protein GCM10023350_12070 [Nocardioides endophyticus]|uniref:Uncharacterized protein n=1 Tax=Nocardioides endophyticus TaxID=1353775 RepID=A0ABP8YJR0_9ACTN